MDFGRTYIEGYLRTTKLVSGSEVEDKQINLFTDATKNKILNNFYDIFFFDLVNGNILGKDPSSTPSVTTGFTFKLATDSEHVVSSEDDFSNFVSLTVSKVKVDKYETEKDLIYEVKMTASYTESTASNPITGVSIYYTYAEGDCDGVTDGTKLILKSINPKDNPLYGAGGLVLEDTTNIEVVFRIRKEK